MFIIFIGKTAVYRAAESNHRDIVDLLVSSGAGIDQEIQDGNYIFLCITSSCHTPK